MSDDSDQTTLRHWDRGFNAARTSSRGWDGRDDDG